MMRIRFDSRLAAAAVATLLAATAGRAQAQDAVITGRVTGEQGRPLAGATVLIPQLSAGTNTNESGNYTITIAASRISGQSVVMTARMVGHAPGRRTITISAGTQTVDFALAHQPVQLNEVVVTGTAEAVEQRKVGFSVGVVNAEQLKEVPATSAAGALAGKVAGAQVLSSAGDPGAAPAIKLRSATSLTGTQEPLIIIDGTITRASLADINSEDIERMEVIKGAAASSLYGSDAANGVIQIWTKRGASLPEDKVGITFRSEYGQSELPKRIPQTRSHYFQIDETTGEFIRDEDGARIEEDDLIADNPYPVYYDHQDDALRNGASYSTYLSLGQRRGPTNYNASWQRTRQEGILFGLKGYDRNNFRLNVDQQVNDRLDVSLGGFYARSNNNNTATGAGSPFFALMFLEPHLDLKAPNADGSKYNVQPEDILWSSNATNVLYTLANTDQNTARNRYTGTFRGRYRILDWLVGEANYNFDGENEEFSILTPKGFLSRTLTPNPGALQQWNVNGRTVNMGVTLSSTRNLTDRIVNTTKASFTYEGQKKDTFNILANNFAVVRTPEFGAITGGATPYSSSQTIRNRNAYLITGFDVNDRYIVDALVRRDESSLFGENERSHTYYRASGSYIVSEDFPMPNVDLLKLRLSRGTAGLRPTFDAQYESYTLSASGAFSPATRGNPDLKPATSTETEAGFNLDFLQRYSFEYTFSNKVTEDQILLVPLSAAAGYRYQWQNAGTLEGNTHEMAFRALLMDRQDFSWRLNITGDRTRQKITKLDVAPFLVGPGYGLGSSEDNNKVTRVFKIQEGETFGVIYGTRTVRNIDDLYDDPAKAALSGAGQAWSRDSVMINEEGYVVRRDAWRTAGETPIAYVDADGNTNVKIGDVNPDFNLAFNTNVSWKGFNVSALVNWVQGGNVYNGTRQWPFFELRDRAFDQSGKPEAEKKPVAYYQFFYNGINPIDYFVEDGSYLKLKELAVNYTIPRTFLGRMRMGALENARIGIVGRNLWTKTDYSGFDPEVAGLAGDPYSFRFDGFSYPNFRTFTGMIELGF